MLGWYFWATTSLKITHDSTWIAEPLGLCARIFAPRCQLHHVRHRGWIMLCSFNPLHNHILILRIWYDFHSMYYFMWWSLAPVAPKRLSCTWQLGDLRKTYLRKPFKLCNSFIYKQSLCSQSVANVTLCMYVCLSL